MFLCFIQGLHHFLTAIVEGSELKNQTLTQILAQPQAWLRSALMICHGWKTRSLVRLNESMDPAYCMMNTTCLYYMSVLLSNYMYSNTNMFRQLHHMLQPTENIVQSARWHKRMTVTARWDV